ATRPRRPGPRLSNPASVEQQTPAAGRPWRGFAAIAVANQGDQTPDIYKRNPRQVLEEMVTRWIAADEAEKAARAIDVTPAAEPEPVAIEAKPEPDDGIDGELA